MFINPNKNTQNFTEKDKNLFNSNRQHKITITWILVATRVWI